MGVGRTYPFSNGNADLGFGPYNTEVKIKFVYSLRRYKSASTNGDSFQSNLLNEPPFMRRSEVDRLHPVNDRSRAHAESVGLFPKRVRLAEKIPVWRRAEVTEWLADPVAWVERHQGARG